MPASSPEIMDLLMFCSKSRSVATSVHVSHHKYRHKVKIWDVNYQCCLLGDVANYHLEYKKLRYVESFCIGVNRT
jgi:hypothetical protein